MEQAKTGGHANEVSVKNLLERLQPMFHQQGNPCNLRLDVEDISLPTRRATALGLVTQELVSNAKKFCQGHVEVRFYTQGENGILEVCDDGEGLPEELDPVRSAHTGLTLVESLARWDLSALAQYHTQDHSGACVRLTLPLRTPSEVRAPIT